MTRRECEECGYSTTTPDPDELFWLGDKPPFSDFNYCPRCGNRLKLTKIGTEDYFSKWTDEDNIDEGMFYYERSISNSNDGLFREDD